MSVMHKITSLDASSIIRTSSTDNRLASRLERSTNGHIYEEVFPEVTQNLPLENRYLYFFFTKHCPFQSHLCKIGKRDSTLCVCGEISDLLNYIKNCQLTERYHIKKTYKHLSSQLVQLPNIQTGFAKESGGLHSLPVKERISFHKYRSVSCSPRPKPGHSG